ncbi:MAG: hypothetical protein IJK60_06435 [Clostridia bacterium]|nr:hypothetical protein [Clostridia bacterium]
MSKTIKTVVSLLIAAAVIMSFAACSLNGGEKPVTEGTSSQSETAANTALQAILDNFKADEQYNEYKSMYQNTVFEEKLEGDSIFINISGDEGVSGNYEFRLDGDYLTYTKEADVQDYTGYAFFMYLKTAADKYLGMDSGLTTGYISGCGNFDIDNKYFISETDEETGATEYKLYIADKWDMPELDTMYVNEKALEYTDALDENYINGVINSGKIRVIYYGSKDSVDIVVSEYGERSDLTYKSIVSTVAKLQPDNSSVFEKYYTELKEGENDGFSVSFTLDGDFVAEHEF